MLWPWRLNHHFPYIPKKWRTIVVRVFVRSCLLRMSMNWDTVANLRIQRPGHACKWSRDMWSTLTLISDKMLCWWRTLGRIGVCYVKTAFHILSSTTELRWERLAWSQYGKLNEDGWSRGRKYRANLRYITDRSTYSMRADADKNLPYEC